MSALIAGFYGKLPARGDFVRVGLPRDFTDRWDEWLAIVMAGSQARMGDDWRPAYLEAPVWRFVLPPGLCGERAVLGLMLPSVDRVGRYFPLTFAALFPGRSIIDTAPANTMWLDRAEAAGRAALEEDAEPDRLMEMLQLPEEVTATTDRQDTDADRTIWWSEGSPRVAASRLSLQGLPDVVTYATMLGEQPPASSMNAAEAEAQEEPS